MAGSWRDPTDEETSPVRTGPRIVTADGPGGAPEPDGVRVRDCWRTHPPGVWEGGRATLLWIVWWDGPPLRAIVAMTPAGGGDPNAWPSLLQVHDAIQQLPAGAIMQLPTMVAGGDPPDPPFVGLTMLGAMKGTPAELRIPHIQQNPRRSH